MTRGGTAKFQWPTWSERTWLTSFSGLGLGCGAFESWRLTAVPDIDIPGMLILHFTWYILGIAYQGTRYPVLFTVPDSNL